MTNKLLVTFGVLLYALAVPLLELNSTHVFNPHWPAHARLHNAWQLVTNSAFGLWALWLTWRQHNVRLPSLMALLITGGFLFAYALQDSYGGSMQHSDGTELTLFGVNVGVLGFGLVVLTSCAVLFRTQKLRQD